jgi:hypothetical protein
MHARAMWDILERIAKYVRIEIFKKGLIRWLQFKFVFSLALPCDLNPNQCQNNGLCLNDNKGDYTCTCANGYTGENCETRNNFNILGATV